MLEYGVKQSSNQINLKINLPALVSPTAARTSASGAVDPEFLVPPAWRQYYINDRLSCISIMGRIAYMPLVIRLK